VQEYAHTYDLKTAVFRMSCIYGTNQFGVEDQGWVAWFTIATSLNKPITIYGDGKQVRDVLFVDDLVSLMDSFLKSDVKQTVLNVGGGKNNTLSLEELLELLKTITKKESKITYADWRAADQKVYISDIKKASATLGWTPRINPKNGVEKLAAWTKEHFNL
jgi:CDP-paratose 2-epimerase